MFHNTGITTYVWVLSNCKAAKRKGKVQLIDASEMYQKLRKNLGAKNCEFSAEHIEQITELYLGMQPSPSAPLPEGGGSKKMISKVFENRDFGYYKVTIERPLRLAAQFTAERVAGLRYVPGLRGVMEWAYGQWGDRIYDELALRKGAMEAYLEAETIELSKKQRDALFSSKTWETQRSLMGVVSWRDESAERVVKKVHRFKKDALTDLLVALDAGVDQLQDFGYWAGSKTGEWVEYESDSELRDTENVPLREEIHGYFEREVRPHVADAWMALDKTQIGYEISFNKYFYKTAEIDQAIAQK
jgi:type I restriction enzyme M protein